MYSLTEHGLLLGYTSEEEFSLAKDKIDRAAKRIKDELKNRTAMHVVAIPDCGGNFLLTCYIKEGVVRLGVYDSSAKTLCRSVNTAIVNKIDEGTVHMLVGRLLSASQKTISLPPLNDLWELSVQKELIFMDAYGFVELKDPTTLDASVKELQEKEIIEKD